LIGIILLKKKENIKNVASAARSNWRTINILVKIKHQEMGFIQFVKLVEIRKRSEVLMRD
jgi:predicted amino acid-binding ACT domain protein